MGDRGEKKRWKETRGKKQVVACVCAKLQQKQRSLEKKNKKQKEREKLPHQVRMRRQKKRGS